MIVLILEPADFPQGALDALAQLGEVMVGEVPADRRGEVEVVFTRLARRLDATFHTEYPALRFIVSPTTGLDHLDLDHFARTGVRVISLRGETAFLDSIHATAEFTIALALALLRDLPGATRAVGTGAWNRYPHKGRELHGKSVLLLGYGRIGRLVRPLYEAFGCRVRAYDRDPGKVPTDIACDLDAALGETDVLSVHVSFDDSTRGLIGDAMLERLPPQAVVINTSRGDIVDQAALLDRIEDGRLAGAALDVLSGEPAPLDEALSERIARLGRRLVVTPHIGGYTEESLDAVELFVTQRLCEAIDAGR